MKSQNIGIAIAGMVFMILLGWIAPVLAALLFVGLLFVERRVKNAS